MPDVETIRKDISELRSYARVLSGEQRNGDRLVAAVVERALAAPGAARKDEHSRVGLFRSFTQAYNALAASPVSRDPLEESLALQPRKILSAQQQALLLRVLQHFSEADIAAILDADVATIGGLVARGHAELETQPS